MDSGKRRMLKRDNATKAVLASRALVSFTNTKHPNDISDTYERSPVEVFTTYRNDLLTTESIDILSE